MTEMYDQGLLHCQWAGIPTFTWDLDQADEEGCSPIMAFLMFGSTPKALEYSVREALERLDRDMGMD